MVRKLLPIGLILAALAVSLYLLLVRIAFSLQPEYDDKGYMLLSLWHFVKQGGLYTRTFSQYGPFYFLLQPFIYKLFGLRISNDSSVLVTSFYLVSACILLSLFLQRLTRMWDLAIVCFLASTSVGFAIFQECGHPQEVVLLLLSASVFLTLLVSQFPQTGFFFLGFIAAFLALTKINVGAFFFFAVLFALAVSLRRGVGKTILYSCIVATCVIVPPVLMHQHFAHWSIPFCIFTVVILLSLCWAGLQIELADPLPFTVLWFLIFGALIAGGSVLAWALNQGISVRDLFSGIILRPSRHPGVFSMSLVIPWPLLLLTVAVPIAIAATFLFRKRIPDFATKWGILKIIVCPLGILSLSIVRVGLLFNAPLLLLLLLSPSNRVWKRSEAFPRIFLCAVIAFELLQAYPVAATHLNVTLMGTTAWALLLMFDGWALVRDSAPRRSRLWGFLLTPIGCAVFAVAMTGVLWGKAVHRVLHVGPPLDLPGSHYLHLTPDYSARFRWLAATIHENCDRLHGLPELGSLNFWAEVPTPNGLNMGAWPLAFTHAEQQSIIDVLRRTSRPCLVHNEKVRFFWAPYGEPQDEPLVDYIFRETVPVSHSGDYEIRVPPSSAGSWREDVILDHPKPLTGDPLGLPEDLLARTPDSTIRFSLRTDRGKLSLTSLDGNTAGLPQLRIIGNRIVLSTGPAVSSATVPALANGFWHQLTLVTTPAAHRLFVDGSFAIVAPSAQGYALPGSLYLLSGTAEIRDFKVVRHAWTAEEVLACFRSLPR